MLRCKREAMRLEEGRGIDQARGFDSSCHAKEPIHKGEPHSGARTRESPNGNAEVREQPGRILCGRSRELLNDEGQLRFAKAIENEMRDDQVVARCNRRPGHDVFVNKTHARGAIGRCLFDAFACQSKHALARVEAIHFSSRMHAEQLAEEPSIPLAHNQRAMRRADFSETSHATPLELIPEGDPLQRSIPRRDGIEAHAPAPISATSGVSSTRSARAVR